MLEASSPDGSARFLVRGQDGSDPERNLELVAHGVEDATPLMAAVSYAQPAGSERMLLVPVLQGCFGPAASYVRLPCFAEEGWTAAEPVSVGLDSVRDAATVRHSVRASLNETTRDAWREVRALISDVGLCHVIDEEPR
ncbi:hypothetical protein [Kitasatospora sp. NPDC097691]|uniref:hypothetical protein n=1 Tax=Kitasatospora sp. NPDC097691 TaxID=3157231 RepID=UPI003332A2A6